MSGLSTDQVGRVAGAAGITLLELTAQQASLEEAFVDLTRDAVEFRAPATVREQRDDHDPSRNPARRAIPAAQRVTQARGGPLEGPSCARPPPPGRCWWPSR